jgi:hypothetical protein
MPFESIGRMMHEDAQGDYAIACFESWRLESLQGGIARLLG